MRQSLATAGVPVYSSASRTRTDGYGVLSPGAEILWPDSTMHPFVHRPPGPTQIMERAEQLSHQGGGSKLSLVFQGITAIGLGVVTTKMLLHMIHPSTRHSHHSAESKQSRER